MTALERLLAGEVWAFLLIFVRVGSVMMLVPGLGEQTIPARIRLTLGLLLAYVMLPLVHGTIPPNPDSPTGATVFILGEVGVGLLIGMALRLVLTAMNVAGSVIAIQSGLAFIQTIDPTQGSQGSLVANFLSLIGLVAIFAADLHVMPIAAIRDSYTLFPPGHWPEIQDMVQTVIDTVASSFKLGIQISAPFIVFGIVFNAALGVLARLIPQMQVTFITLPAQILVAFALLSLTLGTAVTLYLDYFTKRLQTFLM